MASTLFDSIALRSITLRNRIVVSPMCQYSSEEGLANDWHFVHLASRAVGGAALVFTEAAAVTAEGRISPEDLGIWSDLRSNGAHGETLASWSLALRATAGARRICGHLRSSEHLRCAFVSVSSRRRSSVRSGSLMHSARGVAVLRSRTRHGLAAMADAA